jgi:glycosyltransferase involved in cell wall biosynthesis
MIPALQGKSVALAHHWLLSMRGGERVLAALARLIPDAPIFTLVADRNALDDSLRHSDIRTSFLDSLPGGHRHHREWLPLYPLAVRSLDAREFDVVIVSDAALTKGLRVRRDALLLCYCHSPMRAIWSLGDTYARRLGPFRGTALRAVSRPLRAWDRRAARRVDAFAANSQFVRRRIADSFARDSVVIYPPVGVPAAPPERHAEGFYLMVGEMVEYKRTDLGVDACRRLGRPLLVVGDGPERRRLMRTGGDGAAFLGRLRDDEIRALLTRCRALLFCAEEDFGIVPVEAMAAGCPVIAYGRGGATETVLDGRTGLWFPEQTVDSLVEAINRFEEMESAFDPAAIFARAHDFSAAAFDRAITDWISACLA